MNKGKKFNAAEKHFEKKCTEWRKRIKDVETIANEYIIKCNELELENTKLTEENRKLKSQLETLMELKGISNEDLKLFIDLKRSSSLAESLIKTYTSEID